MLRSKLLSIAKFKYFFSLLFQRVFLAILTVDEATLCRIVTDLHLKKLSYNEIREHIRIIYGLDLTKHHLKGILQKAGEKAKTINKRLDHEIQSKIHTIEVDEVFQGKSHAILGVTEKKSQYLIALKPAPDRTSLSINSFLSPLAKKYCNIRVVISDLYKAYKTVIPLLFRKARHLACHIHVQRDSMRRIEKLRCKYARAKNKLITCKKALGKLRQKIIHLSAKKKDWGQKIAQDRQTREKYLIIKSQSKSGKTKTIDCKHNVIRNRILKRSGALSEVKTHLDKARNQREQIRGEIRRLEKRSLQTQQVYLQSCRLQGEFFCLLKNTSNEFPQRLAQFMIRLKSSKYSYAIHLYQMIRNNPHIFSLRKKTDLAWNFQNSNTIERIFGILRPRLDSSRLLRTPEGASHYCDLFRLYYNSTARYTGIHNNQSPYKQIGGSQRIESYLDLLFPTRKRTTLFIGQEKFECRNMGFSVRCIPHQGAVLCF